MEPVFDLTERLHPLYRDAVGARSPMQLAVPDDLTNARTLNASSVRGWPRSRESEHVIVMDHLPAADSLSPPVRVRQYSTALHRLPTKCVFWIHGGGHIMGSIEQDDTVLSEIVAATGCTAFSVDWRAAPEHPYPAEIEDCWGALQWVATHSHALGADPLQLILAGASSGGGTAAALALMCRDRGTIAPIHQVLIYPMLDDRQITPSSGAIRDGRVWNRAANSFAWDAYLGPWAGAATVPYYAAPSRATDLGGLPPATVVVGDLDLFLDEAVDYGARLRSAKVQVEMHIYPGSPHGFDRMQTVAGPDAGARLVIMDAVRRAGGNL